MATSEELSNRYYEMSRKYMRQAMEEFEKGDWSQASEKAWGAVADSIKATAVSRGWNHKEPPTIGRYHNATIAGVWKPFAYRIV